MLESVLFVAGWALATLGVAAVTTPWAWAMSGGLLLIVASLALSARSPNRR